MWVYTYWRKSFYDVHKETYANGYTSRLEQVFFFAAEA